MTFPGTHAYAYRAKPILSGLGWAAAAAVLAALQAFAMLLDVKTGIAFALALIFGALILAKPDRLLPLAVLTVFLESVTLGGLAITRMLAPVMLLVVAAEFLRGTGRIQAGPPLAFASLYLAWALASALWTQSFEGTRFLLQSLAIAFIYLLAFAALPRSEVDLQRFLFVISVAAGLIGALSVAAFAGMPSPPGLALTQAGRSQGGVGDPDFFAAMQLVVVPLMLVQASETRNPRARLVLYAGLMCVLASVFTSLSRGAFIGIMVLGILFIASRPERLFRTRGEKAFALVIVAIGLVGFFSRPFLRDQVVTRAQSIYAPQNEEDKTGSGRTNIWKAAARTAGDYPFTGTGYGSFKYISEDLILHTPGVNLEVYGDRQEGDNYAAHQTYLGTAAELGFTGLALYLAVLVSTMLALRKTAKRAAALGSPFIGRVAHALVLGLSAWAVTAFFLTTETARMFWVIVGLSLALPRLLPERWGGASAYEARSNAPMS